MTDTEMLDYLLNHGGIYVWMKTEDTNKKGEVETKIMGNRMDNRIELESAIFAKIEHELSTGLTFNSV